MTIAVRPATVADAAQIAQVQVDTWRDAYAGILPAETLAALDVAANTERLRVAIAEGIGSCVVAVDGPVVVGFARFGTAWVDQDPQHLDPTAGQVMAIYVVPARQGAGAGRALMDAAVADLKGRGFPVVRLWVLDDNTPARRFYERYGFTPDGARSAYQGVPELRYSLALA